MEKDDIEAQAIEQFKKAHELYKTFIKESLSSSIQEVFSASVLLVADIMCDISKNLPFVAAEDGEIKELHKIDDVIALFSRNVKIQMEIFRQSTAEAIH
jgi:hypothetical protein